MAEKRIWRWYRRHREAIGLTLEFAKGMVPGVGVIIGGLQLVLAQMNDREAVQDEAKEDEMERVLEEIKPIVNELVEEIEESEKFQSICKLPEEEMLKQGQKILQEDTEIREELKKVMPQLSQSLIISISRLENKSVQVVANRYELLEKIGRGGQGEVWKTKHLLAETTMAIKFLPQELSNDKYAVAMIREEYQRVTQLIHPNIVQYRELGYDEKNKRYFLAMDYVAGMTFRMELIQMRKNPINFRKALERLKSIGEALDFAHQKGIVHCDLKPENIIIEENNNALLLTDFGLAQEIRNSLSVRNIKVDIRGTMPYMAPEQYKGRRATTETDIWALGVILYEMVATGNHPFYGTSFEHFKDIVCNEEAERPKILDDSEWNILQRMLTKEKEERISSFATVWQSVFSPRIETTSRKTDDEVAKLAREMEKLQEENRKLQEQIAREKEALEQKKKEEQEQLRIQQELAKAKKDHKKLAAEKRKIEQQKKEQQQKHSENKPKKIPMEIWRACWHNDYFDFSQDIWCSLDVKEQIKYAAAYQNWYAGQQKLAVGKDFVVDKTIIPLRLIPPGKFWMGSPENEKDRSNDEKRHRVLISKAFYMGETVVTQEEWQAVMGKNPSHFEGLQNPVESVSWDSCMEFCKKIGVSLPTEAQWEYACRGGTTTEFNLGNYMYEVNHNQKKTVAVKSLSNKNSWGCYDFHGNVWEWCSDWYDRDYYMDGQTNPKGANSGSVRVLRGGGWFNSAGNCRSSYRFRYYPSNEDNSYGFRCSVPLAAWENVSSPRIETTSKKTDDETAKLAREMEKLQEENRKLQEQIAQEKEVLEQKKKEEEEQLRIQQELAKAKKEEERLAAEKRKFEQMKKEEEEWLTAEKRKIEEQKAAILQKHSQNKAEEIPTEIWRVCWCDDYFDFSQDVWCSLNVREQIKYAAAYQYWYASQQKLNVGKNFVVDKLTMSLRLIPPGKFWMGSPEKEKDRNNDEKRHRVLISKAFYMGEAAVTQEQWQAVMGDKRSHFKGLQNPVENVSWDNCMEFCKKIGASLPTEAQWEYACRGGTTTEFNLGNDISANEVNYNGNYPYRSNKGPYRNKTVAVKSLSNKNSWGCYDFHGNVQEWCSDWYDYNYYMDGQTDPQGANSVSGRVLRVLRGGCWDFIAKYCRSSIRNRVGPLYVSSYYGFRCSVALIN